MSPVWPSNYVSDKCNFGINCDVPPTVGVEFRRRGETWTQGFCPDHADTIAALSARSLDTTARVLGQS